MNENEKSMTTVRENCCAHCHKTSCDGCPVKDLVSEDYEFIVSMLLEGASMESIAVALAPKAV